MDEELRRKIIAEIESCGFPLELRTQSALRERSYFVSANLHFKDASDRTHELDALALSVDNEPEGWEYGPVGLALVVECKQSLKKPWVFFEDFRNDSGLDGLTVQARCLTELTVKDAPSILVGCNNTALSRHHLNGDLPRARTYFEAFKNHDRPTDIFRAAESVCFGIDFLDRWFRKSAGSTDERTLLACGTIVLEGKLCLASYLSGELELTEVPHLLLRVTDCFTQTTTSPKPGNEVIIDVIRADYLERFLDICSQDRNLLMEHMLAIRSAGWLERSASKPKAAEARDTK